MNVARTDDAEAWQLEADLLEWIAAAPAGFVRDGAGRADRYGLEPMAAVALDRDFESLALRLFRFQYERVPVYRRFCDQRGFDPEQVRVAADVPALPVEAFKRTRIATFAAAHEVASFHTSGTTTATPGVLHLDGLNLYDVALERAFRHHVLPDVERMRLLILAASLGETPHSSLGYMFERLSQRCGTAESVRLFRGGKVQWRELRLALEAARTSGTAVCLLGTAFVWAHVVDTAAREGFRIMLPAGSRLLETGGYKGRGRELSPHELRSAIEHHFGIPAALVVAEYGMTEMASQLYTPNLRQALLGEEPGDRGWSYPAWLRPRGLDSGTGSAVDFAAPENRVGLVAQHDLANRCSVAHLLTADLGRWSGATFELLGRCPEAEPRGCGLVHASLER